jgi:hypothetical protein
MTFETKSEKEITSMDRNELQNYIKSLKEQLLSITKDMNDEKTMQILSGLIYHFDKIWNHKLFENEKELYKKYTERIKPEQKGVYADSHLNDNIEFINDMINILKKKEN